MKKIIIASLIVLLAAGAVTGFVAASSGTLQVQTGMGPLHEYMEKALAEKLNIPLETVETEFNEGKTMVQIALDHGVSQANLRTFMLEVRKQALNQAADDGVITQAQAQRMLTRGQGMGYGMMGTGTGRCGGSGNPIGEGMMHRGGR